MAEDQSAAAQHISPPPSEVAQPGDLLASENGASSQVVTSLAVQHSDEVRFDLFSLGGICVSVSDPAAQLSRSFAVSCPCLGPSSRYISIILDSFFA